MIFPRAMSWKNVSILLPYLEVDIVDFVEWLEQDTLLACKGASRDAVFTMGMMLPFLALNLAFLPSFSPTSSTACWASLPGHWLSNTKVSNHEPFFSLPTYASFETSITCPPHYL